MRTRTLLLAIVVALIAIGPPAVVAATGSPTKAEFTALKQRVVALEAKARVPGPTGPAGPVGPRGPQGERGPTGATGATGPNGATGATGPQGPKGERGEVGPQGPRGEKGERGERGPEGPAGSGEEPPTEEEPPGEEEPPTQTTHCFLDPSACGFPDSDNTGVTPGTVFGTSGSIDASTAGQVISGKDVTGTINVVADNVTIRDTRVTQNTTCGTRTTCGNYAIRIDGGVTGTRIEHVETRTAAGRTCEHDIRNTGGSTLIAGSYLHACDSNVYAAGPTTLEDSYGIGKIDISEDHVENVYFDDTTFTAVHDTLLNPVGQTAVIFGNVGGGFGGACKNHLRLTNNLLAGGGYTIYSCGNGSSGGSSVVSITGNRFARKPDAYYEKSGSYGLEYPHFSETWSGNVWDDNGATIPAP